MADAAVLDKIKALEIDFCTELGAMIGDQVPLSLARYFRTRADLLVKARQKGALGTAKELQRAAFHLDELARVMATVDALPSTADPVAPAEPLAHAIPDDESHPRSPIGGSREGLDALVKDSYARAGRCPVGNTHDEHTVKCACGYDRDKEPVAGPSGPDGTWQSGDLVTMSTMNVGIVGPYPVGIENPHIVKDVAKPGRITGTYTPAADVTAYLAGVVDRVPEQLAQATRRGPAEVGYFAMEPAGRAPQVEFEITFHETGTMAPEVEKEIRRMDQTFPMFHEPAAPASSTHPVPVNTAANPGYSWSELATPAVHDAVPAHMSPSQLSTLDTCPAQWRMARVADMPQVPSFSRIGGTALHAAIEELERAHVGLSGLTPSATLGLTAKWGHHFGKAIADEVVKGAGIPMERWHASRGGKEGYDWWRVEGELMLQRYVEWRRDPRGGGDGRQILILEDGRPAIELELHLDVAGPDFALGGENSSIDVKVILDQVWRLPDGSIEIVDLKSGSRTPVDTIQLGTQEHALNKELLNFGIRVENIRSRYFDLRKGEALAAFGATTRHPAEELDARYADAAARRRGPTLPRPSDLCVACPVRYACPAMGGAGR